MRSSAALFARASKDEQPPSSSSSSRIEASRAARATSRVPAERESESVRSDGGVNGTADRHSRAARQKTGGFDRAASGEPARCQGLRAAGAGRARRRRQHCRKNQFPPRAPRRRQGKTHSGALADHALNATATSAAAEKHCRRLRRRGKRAQPLDGVSDHSSYGSLAMVTEKVRARRGEARSSQDHAVAPNSGLLTF